MKVQQCNMHITLPTSNIDYRSQIDRASTIGVGKSEIITFSSGEADLFLFWFLFLFFLLLYVVYDVIVCLHSVIDVIRGCLMASSNENMLDFYHFNFLRPAMNEFYNGKQSGKYVHTVTDDNGVRRAVHSVLVVVALFFSLSPLKLNCFYDCRCYL